MQRYDFFLMYQNFSTFIFRKCVIFNTILTYQPEIYTKIKECGKKKHRTLLLGIFFPHRPHHLLQLLDFIVADWRFGVAVPRELNQVAGAIQPRLPHIDVWHRRHDAESVPSRCRPHRAMAAVVTANDATSFPEVNLVEKFTARHSDFAHEQFVKVVGG